MAVTSWRTMMSFPRCAAPPCPRPGHRALPRSPAPLTARPVCCRRPTGLTVDHAIGREILDELAGDAAQLSWRLHDRDRVVERFQVPDERARIGGLGEPPTKIIRIRGGKLVPNLRRQPATVWAAGHRRDDHAGDTLGKAHNCSRSTPTHSPR